MNRHAKIATIDINSHYRYIIFGQMTFDTIVARSAETLSEIANEFALIPETAVEVMRSATV